MELVERTLLDDTDHSWQELLEEKQPHVACHHLLQTDDPVLEEEDKTQKQCGFLEKLRSSNKTDRAVCDHLTQCEAQQFLVGFG